MRMAIYLLFVFVFLANSCTNCKGPHEVRVLDLVYSNMDKDYALYGSRLVNGEPIDTFYFGNMLMNYENIFKLKVDEEYSYVLFTKYGITYSDYSDTISDIVIEREGKCKEKISRFEFRFNGELRSDYRVVVAE